MLWLLIILEYLKYKLQKKKKLVKIGKVHPNFYWSETLWNHRTKPYDHNLKTFY